MQGELKKKVKSHPATLGQLASLLKKGASESEVEHFLSDTALSNAKSLRELTTMYGDLTCDESSLSILK